MSLSLVHTHSNAEEGVEEIKELTEQFKDILEEPQSLPLFMKDHNHKIMLKKESNSVNQRPYMYAALQKK